MGTPRHRFVAKAQPGVGWRVWDRKLNRWWGVAGPDYPTALLAELNGTGAPDRIAALLREVQMKSRARGR
jgi:hypothetical protein